MSSREIALSVRDVSKSYRIVHQQKKQAGPPGASLLRRLRNPQRRVEQETFWALKDVSFDVCRGDVVALIGRNGAGKSTLLKILSRITEPSAGWVGLYGRVGSLLEVGTGFHPELTGRENIFLNGAILGMNRPEIEGKFDAIVEFAGVERFLDTPVKRFSSGMYVRLAFAVAAHLQPEILIVDEVLAVGDAAFQKKCLGKMEDVARSGRTVLFVSHNMPTVLSLCTQAHLLEQGRLVCSGDTKTVVDRYMQSLMTHATIPLGQRTDRGGNGSVLLKSLTVDNGSKDALRCSDSLHITVEYEAERPLAGASFLVGIYDQLNRPIFFLDSAAAGDLPDTLAASGAVTCVTGPINLTPGACIVNVAVTSGGEIADHVAQALTFEVEPDDFYGTGKLTSRQAALCLLGQKWSAEA